MKKSLAMKALATAFFATCLVVVLSLAACSSGGSGAQEESAPEDPKFAVQLYIDCEQNFIFSRYDVDVIVDDEEVGNVDHGSEGTFALSLTKGQHELVLEKEGASEPDGKTTFVVEDEGDTFSYRIKCTGDQIEINSIIEEEDDDTAEEAESEAPTEEVTKQEEPTEDKESEQPAEKKEQEEPNEEEADKPSESPQPEEPKSARYAYVRRMSYDLYYIIDLDEMTVTYFGTNDSGSMVLPCTGDLENGLTVDYVDYGFQERLQFKVPGSDKILINTDANGFEWEYTKTDLSEAEAVLASVS